MPGPQPTAGIQIAVNGAPLDNSYMEALLDVQVRDSLMVPDTAVVRVRDPAGELVDKFPMKVGAAVEIKLAAIGEQALTTLFKGDVVALEPEFHEDAVIIAVRAYDKSYKLNRDRRSRTYQQMSATDMIRKVLQEAGLAAGDLKSTSVVHEYFQQSMETDWQFCWRLAAMHDFEFVVEDGRAHFRPRKLAGAVARLTWGDNLLMFKPRLTGMGQARDVTVASHDPKAKQPVMGKAASPQPTTTAPAATTRASVVGQLAGGSVTLADRVATTQGEANELAKSALARMAGSFLEADGKTSGDPRIRAGTTVKIDKVGSQFSGDYVLTSTTHTIRGGDQYTTSFAISGSLGHTVTEILNGRANGNGSAPWARDLVVGIVTNNNDPEGMGRVRVKFPALSDSLEGWWARVVTLNAGPRRGMYMLPEVDDEVVVAFEHGDPRRPLVLGAVFNGKDKPPPELIHDKPTKKSVFGVKSDEKVHVEGRQAMTLKSEEKMTLLVETAGEGGTGDFLLDAKGNITQKSVKNTKHEAQAYEIKANQSVTIKGTGAVTVESTASLKLKGATVDIEATGPVNVKGAIINLG